MAWLTDGAIARVSLDLTHQAGSSIFELEIENPGDQSRAQSKSSSTCASAMADGTRGPQPERRVNVGGLCMSDRLHGLRAPAPTAQHQRADKLSTNGDLTFSRRVERGSRRMREPHRDGMSYASSSELDTQHSLLVFADATLWANGFGREIRHAFGQRHQALPTLAPECLANTGRRRSGYHWD